MVKMQWCFPKFALTKRGNFVNNNLLFTESSTILYVLQLVICPYQTHSISVFSMKKCKI